MPCCSELESDEEKPKDRCCCCKLTQVCFVIAVCLLALGLAEITISLINGDWVMQISCVANLLAYVGVILGVVFGVHHFLWLARILNCVYYVYYYSYFALGIVMLCQSEYNNLQIIRFIFEMRPSLRLLADWIGLTAFDINWFITFVFLVTAMHLSILGIWQPIVSRSYVIIKYERKKRKCNDDGEAGKKEADDTIPQSDLQEEQKDGKQIQKFDSLEQQKSALSNSQIQEPSKSVEELSPSA